MENEKYKTAFVLYHSARTLRKLANTIAEDYDVEHSGCLTALMIDLHSAHSHICGLINSVADISDIEDIEEGE